MNRLWTWLNTDVPTKRRFFVFILCIFIYLFINEQIEKQKVIKITIPIVNYDKQIKVLADKIDEQGQLIGAYKHRLSMYDDLFGGRRTE